MRHKREWAATFGGPWQDRGTSLLETRDGGYLVAGLTVSPASRRPTVNLVKTDAEGKALWSKRLGDRWLGYY